MTGLLYFNDDLPPSSFVFSSANSGHKGMLSLPDSSCHPLSCIFAVLQLHSACWSSQKVDIFRHFSSLRNATQSPGPLIPFPGDSLHY